MVGITVDGNHAFGANLQDFVVKDVVLLELC